MLRRTLQIFCLLAAGACLVWAAYDPHFRDGEAAIKGMIFLPVSTALGLIILGSGLTRRWAAAAGWSSLALIGQAVALQMVNAGHGVNYQHFKLPGSLAIDSKLLLGAVTMQALIVLTGLWFHRDVIRARLSGRFRTWEILGIGSIIFVTAATVSREIGYYIQELPFATFIQLINLANLMLAVIAIPESGMTAFRQRLRGLIEGEILGVSRLIWISAVTTTLLSALLCVLAYERHPHLGDEVAYLYHARYLAGGSLYMPLPPVLEAFNLDLMDYDQHRWFFSPPQGWPLVLAIGVLLGAPWLVNPVLAGLCVILLYVLVRELYDRRTATLSALLLGASPWHILLGMSFMTHTAALFFMLAAAAGAALARRSGRIHWALLSGLSAGMVGMIRPLEGVIVAGLVGVWILGLGGSRLKTTSIAVWAAGCSVIGASILYYNKILTGKATTFPIMAWADKYFGVNSNAMGFGPDRGMGWPLDPYPRHGLPDVIVNSNLNITSINIELFGWSTGSIIFIAIFLILRKMRGGDLHFLALWVLVFTAHIFYWFSGGPDFGARYWYLMIGPCVVFTARGAQELMHRLTKDRADEGVAKNSGVYAMLILLVALSLATFLPWRAVDKYYHYLGMRGDVAEMAAKNRFGKSLVLIRGNKFPDFASAAIYNPLDLVNGETIYAWDENEVVHSKLLRSYSDRLVWILEGPSITRHGYRIVEGPVSAQKLLSASLDKQKHGAVIHKTDGNPESGS